MYECNVRTAIHLEIKCITIPGSIFFIENSATVLLVVFNVAYVVLSRLYYFRKR
jgi:hypothetical protein